MVDYDNDLMTIADVAWYLGVSRHTVYRWIAAGRLPATRFSRKVIRVRRSDVEASAERPPLGVGEPRVAYETRPPISEAEHERARRRFKRLLKKHAELSRRPRPKGAPPKGSPQALLEVAGIITPEEGEELRRVIKEAKTYSPPFEFE